MYGSEKDPQSTPTYPWETEFEFEKYQCNLASKRPKVNIVRRGLNSQIFFGSRKFQKTSDIGTKQTRKFRGSTEVPISEPSGPRKFRGSSEVPISELSGSRKFRGSTEVPISEPSGPRKFQGSSEVPISEPRGPGSFEGLQKFPRKFRGSTSSDVGTKQTQEVPSLIFSPPL